MKKLLILAAVFSLLSFSCDWLFEDNENGNSFWAKDITNNKDYKLSAELLAEGKYCKVWAEKGSGVSVATAKNLASIYDTKIYQKMIDTFSVRNFTYSGDNFSNIMDFADAVTDGDGKLTILLLDIKDGYKGGNDAYVAGYFWAGNFFDIAGSNLRDMIYIDTNPGVPESEESCKTLAHELQHLMNFTTTLVNRSEINDKGQLTNFFQMDTWIDEGLASAAEWVYSGEYNPERISWYNNNGAKNSKGEKVMSGSIDKGNNFFVWGNRDNDQYAILDDYATVFLFFQWIRLQGTNDIYKKIITSSKDDYNAVLDNISGYSTWDTLLETWLAANKINSQNGQYGYKGAISNLSVTYAPTSPKSVSLYPGEGVYSLANTNPNVTASGNIVYKYLSSSGISGSHSANTTLLTYNKNSVAYIKDKDGIVIDYVDPENGTVTGAAPDASVSVIADGSRAVSAAFSLPYRIGAGDLLRRNGAEKNLPIGELSLLKEKFIEEEAETNE